MHKNGHSRSIRLAIAGLGNCAASLIEGLAYYRQNPDDDAGLLFPTLAGYSVRDIEIVAAFDVSARKVGCPVEVAIYQPPNNFVRLAGVNVDCPVLVSRGPTLDGNRPHLAKFVPESSAEPVEAAEVLKAAGAQVLVNVLPTGSIDASEYYSQAALAAGCAFVNCIPTVLAQRPEVQAAFCEAMLPLLGDDIKSQIGTTILHRAVLHMLESRGATLAKSSQVNIGGNTDFANFVKSNSAGSIVDLIRVAQGARDQGRGGVQANLTR
ncbi:MAG: hypothetical protein ABI847_08970 [Anaerolineales bacterium]